jgi:hypothetical protein
MKGKSLEREKRERERERERGKTRYANLTYQ